MKLDSISLSSLGRRLQARVEMELKRDVQAAARHFGKEAEVSWLPGRPRVKNGDDAAAIPQADGSYLLVAADGMRADFVATDPWFAGYSAVMVNISDIAAMGGIPQAIVDVFYAGSGENERVMSGMAAASQAFGVPIVGGHTCRTEGGSLVSCAIVGRAEHLIESDGARPGDELLFAVDLRGTFRSPIAFNAATTSSSSRLRGQVGVLPQLAQQQLVHAGKDVSNAGLVGTLLMLLESSAVGAQLELGEIPSPDVDPERWLMAFPSCGYVLSARPENISTVRTLFAEQGVVCERIGTVTRAPTLQIKYGAESYHFADTLTPFTGFGSTSIAIAI